MHDLTKKIFIGLLTGIVSSSNHTKRILLSSQKCMIESTVINLHPNEYSQKFHYYPFVVKLDKCVKVLILLITYLIKYVFQRNEKI